MTTERTMGRMGRAALVLAVAIGTTGCTDWAGHDLDYFWGYIPVLATMRTSVAYDPYEMPRLPAEHTIPVSSPLGAVPPRFTQLQLDSAAATLASPFGAADARVVERGEEMYARQCAVCHGPQGGGTGPAVGPGKYPFAPPINVPTTAARSDGYIYAVITAGRGLMPPYGHALTENDRWAIVGYVRQLQALAPAATQTPGTAAAPATAPASAGPTVAADTAPGGSGR